MIEETITFDEFCNNINNAFIAISTMVELTKTGNEELINILSENGK
jgi:hypothetical protein